MHRYAVAVLWLLLPLGLHAQQATSSPAGDRPIPAWLVLGTFPVDTGALRLDRDYLRAESAAAPVAGESGAGKAWRLVPSDAQGGIDLNRILEAPLERAAAYALTYITSPADRTVSFAIESDDDAVAFLNGRMVYRAEVARGMGRADTITVRLAQGSNRLLVKVVNRTGGFGVGARLLALSADPVADLALATERPAGALAGDPAPWVTLSPARVASQAKLVDGELVLDVSLDVARWGAVDERVRVHIGKRTHDVPLAAAGMPVPVTLQAGWRELAQLIEKPSVSVTWGGHRTTAAFPLAAGDLLSVLSRTIVAPQWDTTSSRLRLTARVPDVLAGLTLTADVAEFVPGGSFAVNGTAVQADAQQRITVCAPCRARQEITIDVDPAGDRWWDPPRLRVQETGWRELADAARFARVLRADASIPLLDASTARLLLPLALKSDKKAYLAELGRLRAPLRVHEAALRGDTIDLVGNSHIDAAWLWRWPETVEVVRNTWRTAVKLLDKYPEMKFAASSAKYYTWLEEYEPELLADIQRLHREGRWLITGGWWVEPDVNTPSGESLVRQGLYGQRTFLRLFGETATVGWIPDTFGYPWTLPQLMAGAGLTSFVTQKLRWNDNGWSADRNFFTWIGPDGTRLPTYIPFGYDHDLRDSRLVQEWRTQRDSAATTRVLTLYGVGDHGGGPTMEMLDRRRDAERIPTLPVLRDADPAASLATMIAGAQNTPEIRDELYFEYHRGVQTSQAAMKQWNRRMEALLADAEAAALAAGGEYPHAALTRAWQRTLFNQFHDILPGSSIGPVYVDAQADYREADSLATGALHAALAALAARADTRPPVKGAQPYFVFNATSSDRTDVITLPVAGMRNPVALDARGRALRAAQDGDSLRVLVRDVPALAGTTVFTADLPRGARLPAKRGGYVLENDSLRVEIDPRTGNIARLHDRRLDRELLAPGAQGNVLMTMVDTPKEWDAWNIDHTNGPWTPIDSALTVGQVLSTPLGDELVVTWARPDVSITQRYFLPAHAARLDIASTVEWRASHKLLKAFFPLAVGADSVWAEIPYGAIARVAVPRTRADSAKFELPMQRWIDASRDGWGVSLVNDAKHGYDVRGDTLRLSLLRAPKYPDPDADMGTHRFTYGIVPHAGDWRSGATFAAVTSLNRPFRVIPATPHAGAAALTAPLGLEGIGVELGGFKRTEDGEGWIVRLVERHGSTATATLRVPGAWQWREVDFVERGRSDWADAAGETLQLMIGPWQIRTLEVKRTAR